MKTHIFINGSWTILWFIKICNNESQSTVLPFGQNEVSILQHRELPHHAHLPKLLAVLLTCKETHK